MREQLKQLATGFERLSGREQAMVLFMVIALGSMVLGLTGYLVNRDLGARAKRIDAKLEKLRQIAELKSDYQARLAQQQQLANEVRSNGSTRILSYLEDASRRADLELKNATERAGEPTGSEQVKEESAEVTVTNVSLDRLHAFLDLVETGNRLVRIRRLKIKTRFDNPQMLDATVTVSTYKPTGG
jgi:general secretion pathway protein M